MNQRKMRIGMSIRGHGYHPAAWRHPDVAAECTLQVEHYVRSAQTAERGKLDLIFFADGAGIRQPERTRRAHPFSDQVLGQAFAQAQLDDLAEPGLQNIENEKHAGDLGEDDELMEKGRKVASLERVVERLVPSVEDDLTKSRHNDDNGDADAQPNDLVAQWRGHEGPMHHPQLITEGLFVAWFYPAAIFAVRPVRHRCESLLPGLLK